MRQVLSLMAQTDGVQETGVQDTGEPGGRLRPWRPWTICVAAAVALIASILLLVGDALAGILASWDSPAPGQGWLKVAVIGHVVLAVGSIILLATGLSRPSRRRAAVILAWAIVPVGFGWFVLFGRLASGAWGI
jgi:hypothetical protein